jgi:peptide/nickel transport system permease protein
VIRFILARLVKAVVILLAILVLNFTLIHMAPGDPAAVMAGEAGATDEQFLEDLRAGSGWISRFLVQLWIYIKGAIQLDLGYSYRRGMPVAELLLGPPARDPAADRHGLLHLDHPGRHRGGRRRRASGTLGRHDHLDPGAAVLRHTALLDRADERAALLGRPRLAAGLRLRDGRRELHRDRAGDRHRAHLILPATTLGLFFTAVYMRMTRASMLEVSRLDFVKTARAKGLKPASSSAGTSCATRFCR